MANASQQLEALVTEYNKPALSTIEEVTKYIKEHMPKYVYYSNYGNLDSQIYLPQVLQNISRTDLGVKDAAKARTLKTLFKFVQLDPKEITDLGSESSGNLSQQQIDSISEKKKESSFIQKRSSQKRASFFMPLFRFHDSKGPPHGHLERVTGRYARL